MVNVEGLIIQNISAKRDIEYFLENDRRNQVILKKGDAENPSNGYVF